MKSAKRFAKFASRLSEARNHLHLSQAELAKKTGISLRTMQYWEEGRTQPYGDNLRKLSATLGVEANYLLGHESPGKYPPGNAMIVLNEASLRTRRCPVVSWANAGLGGSFDDLANQIQEYADVETSDENAYLVIIQGDSMEPNYQPGDRVVLSPNSEPINGDVVVARLFDSGQVYLKLFHQFGKNGEMVRLTSYNPAYPPLEFERSKFRFIHPVIEMRRMRRR